MPRPDRSFYAQTKAFGRFGIRWFDPQVMVAEHYHGPWDEIRDRLTDPAAVNYTRFETHVLPDPWNRGRVVFIGDAAHVCPPTLAQGGAQALEDAAVLAELLVTRPVDDALWAEFMARRLPRAQAVVDASVQIGQWISEILTRPSASRAGRALAARKRA